MQRTQRFASSQVHSPKTFETASLGLRFIGAGGVEIVLGLLSLRGVAGVWLALLHSADVVQTGAGHAAGCGALLNTTSNKDGIALHIGDGCPKRFA